MAKVGQKFAGATGTRNRNAKLNEAQVREIRKALKENANRRELASKYGVSLDAIKSIHYRLTWRHVKEDEE